MMKPLQHRRHCILPHAAGGTADLTFYTRGSAAPTTCETSEVSYRQITALAHSSTLSCYPHKHRTSLHAQSAVREQQSASMCFGGSLSRASIHCSEAEGRPLAYWAISRLAPLALQPAREDAVAVWRIGKQHGTRSDEGPLLKTRDILHRSRVKTGKKDEIAPW